MDMRLWIFFLADHLSPKAAMKLWLLPLLLGWCVALSASEVTFIALGDLPYGKDDSAGFRYRQLIATINQSRHEFSIHVGDIKSGSSVCSDEELLRQREHFNLYERPVIYTPGDNEWTDCHRKSNGGYDPLERLARLRSVFFSSLSSMGKRSMQVATQPQEQPQFSQFVENRRWQKNSILFLTVHIVGSNNNFESRDPKAVAEFFDRDRANIGWINAAFDLAERENLEAIVIAFQADVLESASRFSQFPSHSGFKASVGDTIIPRSRKFGRPVLLISGDSHEFKFGQPFTIQGESVSNLYQLVVPGNQDVRAVQVTIDARSTSPFSLSMISPITHQKGR
jgi:hypothetical protein